MTDLLPESPEEVKKWIDKAAEFLGKVVNPPLTELGLLSADRVRFWRFKQQVKIILKAKEFVKQKGIEPAKISLKVLVPLLEHCSLEEDQDMQARWAALLANAADPNCKSESYITYVEILKRLSPLEAKILDVIYDDGPPSISVKENRIDYYNTDNLLSILNISREQLHIFLENLFQLNLVEPLYITPIQVGKQIKATKHYEHIIKLRDKIIMTNLGFDFVGKCRINEK